MESILLLYNLRPELSPLRWTVALLAPHPSSASLVGFITGSRGCCRSPEKSVPAHPSVSVFYLLDLLWFFLFYGCDHFGDDLPPLWFLGSSFSKGLYVLYFFPKGPHLSMSLCYTPLFRPFPKKWGSPSLDRLFVSSFICS